MILWQNNIVTNWTNKNSLTTVCKPQAWLNPQTFEDVYRGSQTITILLFFKYILSRSFHGNETMISDKLVVAAGSFEWGGFCDGGGGKRAGRDVGSK